MPVSTSAPIAQGQAVEAETPLSASPESFSPAVTLPFTRVSTLPSISTSPESPVQAQSESPDTIAPAVKVPTPSTRVNRPARKSTSEASGELFAPEEILSVEADAFDAETTSALSADGATRLLVTAYIGIGNKLFIRGEGAGLSWTRGVPLQFVSIGKWRWETNDITQPIQVRLYKNDQVECTAVGTVTLEPGNQHELTAKF